MPKINNKRIIFVLISIAGFIFSSLLIGELLVRLSLVVSGQGGYIWLPDYYLGAVHAPNSKFIYTAWSGKEFVTKHRTNSLGLVGEEISLNKPENTFRILILGDSFTEGLQVNEGRAFCERLQYLLDKDFSLSGKHFEVINAGTSGFSPIAEYLFLKRELIKLKPDLVILQLFANDVFEDNKAKAMSVIGKDGLPVKINRFFIKKYLKNPDAENRASDIKNFIYKIDKFILDRSILFQCFDRGITRTYKNTRINRKMNDLPEFNDNNQFFIIQEDNILFKDDTFRNNAWSNTKKYILAIQSLTEDNNARFLMFYIPAKEQLKLSQYGGSGGYLKQPVNYFLNDRLKELSRKEAICYLDLLPALEENKDKDLYYNIDSHFKEAAHMIVAKALCDSLNNFKLLDESTKEPSKVRSIE